MNRSERNFLAPLKKNRRNKTFVIAEAGVHHGGSLEVGKKLITAAASAGADAIKFQTYKAETLVTRWAAQYWQSDTVPEAGPSGQATQFDYFKKRDSFGPEEYAELSRYAAEVGIHFSSTPFDRQSVEWLTQLDVPFWKIASADLDNFPLLAQVARTGKPVILSTGASYLREVDESVRFLRAEGVADLALMHCNLAYPTPNNEANLGRIALLRGQFPDLVIGYSDHTIPDEHVTVPVAAVTLGAEIIEKHFTLDRSLPEDDHYHSVNPVLLRSMIQQIETVEQATGMQAEITPSEAPARQQARRSLVANEDIASGQVLTRDLLVAKRPGGGISPKELDHILGKRTKVHIVKDDFVLPDALEQ